MGAGASAALPDANSTEDKEAALKKFEATVEAYKDAKGTDEARWDTIAEKIKEFPPESTTVLISGVDVPVKAGPGVNKSALDRAVGSNQFKDWVKSIEEPPRQPNSPRSGNAAQPIVVKDITMQGVDMFGPKVGFIKFNANAFVDGKFVPGIVFMRGGAVAILVILACEGKDYVLLVKQPRVPVGDDAYPEIPAGMLDGSGHFGGMAAKELKQETEIEIEEKDLTDMTKIAFEDHPDALKSAYRGIVPSCGGSDEFIRLYHYRKEVERAELEKIRKKNGLGVRAEGETIALGVVPFEEVWNCTSDGKTLAALHLFTKLQELDKIKTTMSEYQKRINDAAGGTVLGMDEEPPKAVVLGEVHVDQYMYTKTDDKTEKIGLDGERLKSFEFNLGGKGAIEAVWLARLGVPTRLFTRIGKDDAGKFMEKCLVANNVNMTLIGDRVKPEKSQSKEERAKETTKGKMALASGSCTILPNAPDVNNLILNENSRLTEDIAEKAAQYCAEKKAEFLLVQDEIGIGVIRKAVGPAAPEARDTKKVLCCWPAGMEWDDAKNFDIMILNAINMNGVLQAGKAAGKFGELDKVYPWDPKKGMEVVKELQAAMRAGGQIVINTFRNYLFIYDRHGPGVIPIPFTHGARGLNLVGTHDALVGCVIASLCTDMEPGEEEKEEGQDAVRFRQAAALAAYGLNYAQCADIWTKKLPPPKWGADIAAANAPENREKFEAFIKDHHGEWIKDPTNFERFARRWAETGLVRRLEEDIKKLSEDADPGARTGQTANLKELVEKLQEHLARSKKEGEEALKFPEDTQKQMSEELRTKIILGEKSVATKLTRNDVEWQGQSALHLAVLLCHADLVSSLIAAHSARGEESVLDQVDYYTITTEGAYRGWESTNEPDFGDKQKEDRIKAAFGVQVNLRPPPLFSLVKFLFLNIFPGFCFPQGDLSKLDDAEDKSKLVENLLKNLEVLDIDGDDKFIKFVLEKLIGKKAPKLLDGKNCLLTWAARKGCVESIKSLIGQPDFDGSKHIIHPLTEAVKQLNPDAFKEKVGDSADNKKEDRASDDIDNRVSAVANLIGRAKDEEELEKIFKDPNNSGVKLLSACLNYSSQIGEKWKGEDKIKIKAKFQKLIEECARPLPDGCKWHFFLSHKQTTGQNQTGLLDTGFQKRHFKPWYDMNVKNLTTEGMKEGVTESAVFMLFLSQDVFKSDFVQLEVQTAYDMEKPIFLVFEDDSRHGPFTFPNKQEALGGETPYEFIGVKEEFQETVWNLIANLEAIPFRRRQYEQNAMFSELEQRYSNREEEATKLYSNATAQSRKNSMEGNGVPGYSSDTLSALDELLSKFEQADDEESKSQAQGIREKLPLGHLKAMLEK